MACSGECNRQIRGLQARIQQAEDDISAHYYGLSQLVLALAANPFTAASAAPSAIIYNLNILGMKLLRQLLLSLVPPELLKLLRMQTTISAASIEAAMDSLADLAAAEAIAQVNAGIDAISATAMNTILSTTSQLAALDSNFNASLNALTNPVTFTSYRQPLLDAFNSANIAYQNAINAVVGTYTQPAINALNVAKLNAQRNLAILDAGIGSAFLDASGALSPIYGTVAQVNDGLKQVNGVLGFLTTQSDISKCKSISFQLNAK